MLELFSKGKAVKMPETLADLTVLCPELIAQAKDEAMASMDIEAARQEAMQTATAAADAQTERIYGIIGAALSGEIATKIQAIVASGVTAEQYKAIGQPLIALDSARESNLKTDLLTAIQTTGAENPGHEGQAKGRQFDADADSAKENQEKIDRLVAEYRAVNPTASFRDSVLAVSEQNPELFRDR